MALIKMWPYVRSIQSKSRTNTGILLSKRKIIGFAQQKKVSQNKCVLHFTKKFKMAKKKQVDSFA